MGATRKQLTTVSYVTDTDVGYYSVGEVDGIFNEHELQQYIKTHGHEKLRAHLHHSSQIRGKWCDDVIMESILK